MMLIGVDNTLEPFKVYNKGQWATLCLLHCYSQVIFTTANKL